MKRVQQFLDYAATQEPAVTTYRASDMVLAIHSDVGYLNKENARSRAGGHHFISEDVPNPPNNGAIHNEASIIKVVMSSAAEAEMGALYTNARKGVEIRNILEEMGHKQPPTRTIQQPKASSTHACNETHKSDGHAFSLTPRSRRKPATIPFLLAPRHTATRGLLDEASFPHTPSPNAPRNLITIQSGDGLKSENEENKRGVSKILYFPQLLQNSTARVC
eukprot:CCRYP_018253-RA/>CCRYP_018253-RA protein AED:0.45 eAED:0.43 QI:0/0/0/1/0/0/2/0/219